MTRGWCGAHYTRWRRHGDVFAEIPIGRRRPPPCTVDRCTRVAEGRGLCHGHLQRLLRTGGVQADVPLAPRQAQQCSVLTDGERCERRAKAAGLCTTHYARARKHGEPLKDQPIRVVTGEGSLSHGYWYVPVSKDQQHLTGGTTWVGEHRLVMARHLGRALHPDEVVHHRNGRRTDNRIENLELWSTSHPKGQRVDEKVAHAVEMLRRYAPDLLR